MKRSILLWTLALIITVASAVYQRMTGPTYPFRTTVVLNEKPISVTLHRTHGGEGNHPIVIAANDETISGAVEWKRLNTNDAFTSTPLISTNGNLYGELPHQPPAGKLEYRVKLTDGKKTFTEGTVIRFKGDVPTPVLIIHVFFMFGGMFLSTRAGLEVFAVQPKYKWITNFALLFLTVGGMIMGPVVLHYAFNELWTGFPFGTDITDNKTLAAFIVWLIAAIAVRKSDYPGRWVVAASIATLLVFLIPHSLWGTELNYQTMQTN